MFSTLMTTGTPSLTPATRLRIACELTQRADTWRTLVEHDADADGSPAGSVRAMTTTPG